MTDGLRIRTRANGPYLVEGPVTLVDPDGQERFIPEGQNVALCRCGHSATKPFCDSSHKRVDFVSRPSFAPEAGGTESPVG
jgi:CDGSH iron-sulfur domain-containing protein 3